MKNSFIYTIIFTFVLCFFFVLILSFTNAATKDRIIANREFAKNQAILLALGLPFEEVDTKEEVEKEIALVKSITKGDNVYYEGNFELGPAYAKKYSGPGLWGTITGYIAFSEDLTKAVGFQVTDQSETPGLGARISEQWFIDQFKGEKIVDGKIVLTKSGTGDKNKDNGSVDGISGATRTTESIQAIVNKEITTFKEDLGR